MLRAYARRYLLNFIGESSPVAREQLLNSGINLARWKFENSDNFIEI